MIGLAKGALESVLPYLHDRVAFGQPVADFQVPLLLHVLSIKIIRVELLLALPMH